MRGGPPDPSTPLEIRMEIESHLAPAVLEMDSPDEFETSFRAPFMGAITEDVEIHTTTTDDTLLVTLFIQYRDLRSLHWDWDGFSYPTPTNSPRPHKTELRDHGEDYEAYRDLVVETITAEFGLKQEYSLADAVSDGDEPVFTCLEYEGAHANFGPVHDASVPYLCGFRTDVFWEFDD